MAEYLVSWYIDIDAATPDDAAIQALTIQRDPDSIATVFEVTDQESGEKVTVDLRSNGGLMAKVVLALWYGYLASHGIAPDGIVTANVVWGWPKYLKSRIRRRQNEQ